jgi:hypothetical protein
MPRPFPRRRLRPIARPAAALGVALAMSLAAGCGDPHRAASGASSSSATAHVANARPRAAFPRLLRARRPHGTPVRVAVSTRALAGASPREFLGLSFEARDLPLLARYATHGDLLALLRALGPGVLRIGGVSADEEVAWAPTLAPAARPPWAHVALDPQYLASLAALARSSGWRVLLTVNLGHYDPAAAAREAAAAHAALGGALAGIEIGNEPDHFVLKRLRPPGWGIADYLRETAAYRAAIAAAAPGVPIAGPDPATGREGLGWLRAAAGGPTSARARPALLTDHFYPLSSCGYRPRAGELLSASIRAQGAAQLRRALAIARAARRPLRLDEVGSVSCEGFPGVSDSFAAALWALEYTARALAAGAAGINFHDLPAKRGSYSPLLAPTARALGTGALRAQPAYYALLAARALPRGTPLAFHVRGAAPGELGASAFRGPDGRLRLVLVDYDPPRARPLAIRLVLPRAPGGRRYARGAILRLTAPSPAATAGVRLAGRAVAADGSWSAPPALPSVYAHAGALALQLDPASAAVVTLSA